MAEERVKLEAGFDSTHMLDVEVVEVAGELWSTNTYLCLPTCCDTQLYIYVLLYFIIIFFKNCFTDD